MSTIQIKNRFTGAVIFEISLPPEIAAQSSGKQLGFAIREALNARANLAGAYLADADLAGANLADADLTRANLTGAYLTGAYLAGAYLADADLAGADLARANLAGADLAGAYLADAYLADAYLARADLAGANLAGANLAGAYLADADLAGANLADADLTRANLTGADLTGAYLAGAYLADADLAGAKNVPDTNGTESIQGPEPTDRAERQRLRAERYRTLHPEVPFVQALDAKILSILESGNGALEMGTWHQCETTHCRGGWATTLAGPQGQELENEYGVQRAASMIYRASTGRVPNFFASNARALEDIKEQALLQGSQL